MEVLVLLLVLEVLPQMQVNLLILHQGLLDLQVLLMQAELEELGLCNHQIHLITWKHLGRQGALVVD